MLDPKKCPEVLRILNANIKKKYEMSDPLRVMTKHGSGKLFGIEGDTALVEFDYTYLVSLPLTSLRIITREDKPGGEGKNER
jgi:hypothetical protein